MVRINFIIITKKCRINRPVILHRNIMYHIKTTDGAHFYIFNLCNTRVKVKPII